MEREAIKKLMATDRSDKKFMPDDHSKLEPSLPIPNRTLKRLRADDSADSRVKVGHRQSIYSNIALLYVSLFFCAFTEPRKNRLDS